MSKKEHVSIVRTDDFEAIDEELSRAMSLVEESNARVLGVLTAEDAETGVPAGEAEAGDVEADEAAEEPAGDQ